MEFNPNFTYIIYIFHSTWLYSLSEIKSQTYTGILGHHLKMHHERFLLNPFQSIIHNFTAIQHCIAWESGKQPLNQARNEIPNSICSAPNRNGGSRKEIPADPISQLPYRSPSAFYCFTLGNPFDKFRSTVNPKAAGKVWFKCLVLRFLNKLHQLRRVCSTR
jgi:hypothetical protein